LKKKRIGSWVVAGFANYFRRRLSPCHLLEERFVIAESFFNRLFLATQINELDLIRERAHARTTLPDNLGHLRACDRAGLPDGLF
jgi:hypothetical protein